MSLYRDEPEFMIVSTQSDEENLEMLRENALSISIEDPNSFKNQLMNLPERLIRDSINDHHIPIGIRNDILEVHLSLFNEEELKRLIELHLSTHSSGVLVNEAKRTVMLSMSSNHVSMDTKLDLLMKSKSKGAAFSKFLPVFAETLRTEELIALDKDLPEIQGTRFISGLIANSYLDDELKRRRIIEFYDNCDETSYSSDYFVNNWLAEMILAEKNPTKESISVLKRILSGDPKTVKIYLLAIALNHPALSVSDFSDELQETFVSSRSLQGSYAAYSLPEIWFQLYSLKNLDPEVAFRVLKADPRQKNGYSSTAPMVFTGHALDDYALFPDDVLDWAFKSWLSTPTGIQRVISVASLRTMANVFSKSQQWIYLNSILNAEPFARFLDGNGPSPVTKEEWSMVMNQVRSCMVSQGYDVNHVADKYVQVMFKDIYEEGQFRA